jgi:tetratricopeptide (TPR) repeat protein
MRATRDGNRSHNPDKYKRDIEVLEKAIVDEPNNTRYRFYLAQSYRDDGNNEKALEHYQKRVDMGGWAEEVYYSLLQIAHCKAGLQLPLFDVIDAYLKAHHYRPGRLEALCSAIRLCRIQGKHYLGYHLGRHITDNPPMPDDILFVEKAVYDWLLLDEISLCAVYAGQPQLAAQLMKRLLELSTTPSTEQARLGNNLRFALAEAL